MRQSCWTPPSPFSQNGPTSATRSPLESYYECHRNNSNLSAFPPLEDSIAISHETQSRNLVDSIPQPGLTPMQKKHANPENSETTALCDSTSTHERVLGNELSQCYLSPDKDCLLSRIERRGAGALDVEALYDWACGRAADMQTHNENWRHDVDNYVLKFGIENTFINAKVDTDYVLKPSATNPEDMATQGVLNTLVSSSSMSVPDASVGGDKSDDPPILVTSGSNLDDAAPVIVKTSGPTAATHNTGAQVVKHYLTAEEITKIPRDDEGRLTSIGSINHRQGTCRPCAFINNPKKQGCVNGVHCMFCHFVHPKKKKPPRPSKQQRMAQKLGKVARVTASQDQDVLRFSSMNGFESEHVDFDFSNPHNPQHSSLQSAQQQRSGKTVHRDNFMFTSFRSDISVDRGTTALHPVIEARDILASPMVQSSRPALPPSPYFLAGGQENDPHYGALGTTGPQQQRHNQQHVDVRRGCDILGFSLQQQEPSFGYTGTSSQRVSQTSTLTAKSSEFPSWPEGSYGSSALTSNWYSSSSLNRWSTLDFSAWPHSSCKKSDPQHSVL